MLARLVQFLNANLPIEVTPGWSATALRLLQPSNVPSPISERDVGRAMLAKLEQLLNAAMPMEERTANGGILTLNRLLHSENAKSRTEERDGGRSTLDKLVQRLNA